MTTLLIHLNIHNSTYIYAVHYTQFFGKYFKREDAILMCYCKMQSV